MRMPGTNQLQKIIELLRVSELPIEDLNDQDLSLFLVAGEGNCVEAVGGLQRFGDSALLRSVATSESSRGRGLARKIVEELERVAVSQGIRELYLLTESAGRYFESLNYEIRSRDVVPQSIQGSHQFSSLCPVSAIVMCKRIGV